MKTNKIAITIPINLLETIDALAKKPNISRSQLISDGARFIAKKYQQKNVAKKYHEIFSHEDVQKDQIQSAESFININSSLNDEY